MNVSANETARCGASAPVPKKKPSVGFKIVDCLLIAGILLPLLGGIVIRVLTHPVESGISITGAVILAEFDFPLQKLQLTEAQVNSWLVMASISALCLFLAHGLNSGIRCRRHLIAEWIVEKTDSLVHENMGDFFRAFSPFVAAIMALSLFSSLQSLLGLFPPTSDFNVVFGWSLLVFIIITHYKLKGGLGYYLKGFTEPFLPFTPLNILGEVATPISMAFRHYGNVLSGSVVSALIAAGLASVSAAVFGKLPGVLGSIPFLQVGLPAVLSIYFDVFSGCLQAFIFAMLTMLNIAGGFPEDKWLERRERKAKRKQRTTGTQKA